MRRSSAEVEHRARGAHRSRNRRQRPHALHTFL